MTAVIEASVGGGNCRKGKLSGWAGFFQNESQRGICCNENSAAGQAPLLWQVFLHGEPQERPNLMHAEDNY